MSKGQSFSMPLSQRPEKYAACTSSAAPMSCKAAPSMPSGNGYTSPTSGVGPKKIGGGVSTPVLIYSLLPEYSEQAKTEKVGGTVLVNFWVDEQGRTKHVRVLRGVGMGLDEKAVETARQYKFTPAMEGGKPVLVELNTEVNFKIF
jgi:TonB family protein